MDSLNDLIWNPEDDDVLTPDGIGEGCMLEICITAFCTASGGGGGTPPPPDPPHPPSVSSQTC